MCTAVGRARREAAGPGCADRASSGHEAVTLLSLPGRETEAGQAPFPPSATALRGRPGPLGDRGAHPHLPIAYCPTPSLVSPQRPHFFPVPTPEADSWSCSLPLPSSPVPATWDTEGMTVADVEPDCPAHSLASGPPGAFSPRGKLGSWW